jgi:hypothetical protein
MILKPAFLILYVTSLIFIATEGRADDSLIFNSIVDSHKKLDSEFGDLHCRWKASETKEGKTRDYSLSFWSKDKKFYRFDKTEIGSNGEAISTTTRMVIRPEGFVVIRAANADDAGVLIDFGSNFDGLDRLTAEFFFNSATRYAGFFQIQEAIDNCLSRKNGTATLNLHNAQDLVVLKWTSTRDELRFESFVHLDSPLHRCLSTTSKSFKNNELQNTKEVLKTYDDNLVVPATHVETWTYSDGAEVVTKYERTFCSFDSPPLEVFAVSANGLGTQNGWMRIWIRRLVLLVVGVSLLAIYFTYRNKKTSTPAA